MNALNKVKIENTFRINAASALEAATLAGDYGRRDTVSVKAVAGEENLFVTVSTISSSTYYDVAFVELVSPGKYRVEVGSVKIREFEYLQLVGGDDAVNEIGFYLGDRDNGVISAIEYKEKLAYWIENDLKEGTPGRMENYVMGEYKKVTMINGEFE